MSGTATISHDGRHAGRGGLGAVMGAKNLKGDRGPGRRRRIATADPQRVLAKAARDLRGAVVRPGYGESTRELGTLANLLAFNAIATLPTLQFPGR